MENERRKRQKKESISPYASNLDVSFYHAAAEAMRENGLGNVTVTNLHQQEYDGKRYVSDSFQYRIEFDSPDSRKIFELLHQEALKIVPQAEDEIAARISGIEKIRKTAEQIKEGTFPLNPKG